MYTYVKNMQNDYRGDTHNRHRSLSGDYLNTIQSKYDKKTIITSMY